MTSSFSTTANYEPSTLVDLLSWRARHQPDQLAYTFLIDGETKEAALTYAALDARARAIGAWLQSISMSGERVLLLYPPGLEYIAAFFGCLYAGAIAVPTYPPRLNRNLIRLQAIAADAQAKVAMTTAPILSKIEPLLAQAPPLETMLWRATDDLRDDLAGEWREPAVEGSTIAFLQYTSGSTAAPKGVMVSHENLLHNEKVIKGKCGHSEQSVFVGWLPLYHDMGLIGNVLQPLYVGFPSFLMSPMAFLERPFRWLNAISRYKGTTSGGPNFAYDLCVRKVTAEQLAMLDLSSWEVAFNGAEPVRHKTLERFATAFALCGFRREAFYPCYGLAEATLMVSGGPKESAPLVIAVQESALRHQEVVIGEDNEDVKELVSCGQTYLNHRIVIADPESLKKRLPNQIGEIWVSGPSVARGYWNQPEKTKQILQAYLADTGEGPFLRTGDLGFLKDGDLFVTGRIKDLIIIRGSNYYPQDIELAAEGSHAALRPGRCAAFSVDVHNEEQLVIVVEADDGYEDLAVDAVMESIRQAVAEQHELQVHTVVMAEAGSIPKTTSGKLQRYACREEFLSGKLKTIGASTLSNYPEAEQEPGLLRSNDLSAEKSDALVKGTFKLKREKILAAVPEKRRQIIEQDLSAFLIRSLKPSTAKLDVSMPLYSLGVDSLVAAELKNYVEENFGLDLPMTVFLEEISISQLSVQVLERITVEQLLDSVRMAETKLTDDNDWEILRI
jgi:acyl-CoA synthetase (AMP-forming)/AMP-acid ligase II/acyl carrier protein